MPMMVAGLIPCIAALGSAIDIGRAYIVRSQLQAGVDAAALAGARAFGVNDATPQGRAAQVDRYFSGNFPTTYMGVQNLVVAPTFTVESGINVTRVVATATLPYSFMRAFGFDETEVQAVAKAELQPRPLEVMVVLDNTGSMRENLTGTETRITALKRSANDFVDIVHQGATSRRDLALGFVPYDVTVNVGKLLPAGSVVAQEGFTTFNNAALAGSWGSPNPYAWKGCVMNDTTVRDVNATRTFSEAGAWDVRGSLPGTGSHPAVQPYFVPPMYIPKLSYAASDAAQRADDNSDYYKVVDGAVEGKNNLYRLNTGSSSTAKANYLANTPIYRSYLYDYYIGLNNGNDHDDDDDDVIRRTNGNYLNPNNGKNNDRTGDNWYVDWTRIPRYNTTDWTTPANGVINSLGGRVNNINNDTTPMPNPNWQCPEEAMLLAYGRQKSVYQDYIRDDNAAIYPGNGTIHHSGLLWAYRLMVNDTVFTRSNPTNEAPKRAIVFMTDGLNEVNESPSGNWYNRTFTWYGRWADQNDGPNSLSTNESNSEAQMLRRFAKTCANIQRETNAPQVYIIALVANSAAVNTAFDECAPGRVYRTSSSTELQAAFRDVAAELVDLHLVQ